MILYHATSAAAVPSILKQGLQPRQISGVEPTYNEFVFQGIPEFVYLAKAYASFFAADKVGSENGFTGEAAILEIDTSLLDDGLFLPDDFAIAQVLAEDRARAQYSFEEITVEARDGISQLNDLWRNSLELMGTCAYQGTVPPAAIKRVCYIDFSKMKPAMFFDITDISLSVQAFSLCANKYKMIDAWFWGGDMKLGYGLLTDHQLEQLADHKSVKKAFSELWTDRSMVRIEKCR